jgi:hypothetical protein
MWLLAGNSPHFVAETDQRPLGALRAEVPELAGVGMNFNINKRPSEVLRLQREIIREQAELIDILKGALAAGGIRSQPASASCVAGLTPQERALVGVLFAHFPNPVHRFDIMESLPGHDHVQERQQRMVDVLVCRVRNKLGGDAVITERGVGFRLGEGVHGRLSSADIGAMAAEPRRFDGAIGSSPTAG